MPCYLKITGNLLFYFSETDTSCKIEKDSKNEEKYELCV